MTCDLEFGIPGIRATWSATWEQPTWPADWNWVNIVWYLEVETKFTYLARVTSKTMGVRESNAGLADFKLHNRQLPTASTWRKSGLSVFIINPSVSERPQPVKRATRTHYWGKWFIVQVRDTIYSAGEEREKLNLLRILYKRTVHHAKRSHNIK